MSKLDKRAISILVIAILALSFVLPLVGVSALAVPTLSVYSGDKGDLITVSGGFGQVTSGATLEIYWDTAMGTSAILLNTTTGKADGSYSVDFKVPEAVTGDHYVWAKDISGPFYASSKFRVDPLIKLSPDSGLIGDEITVKGYGFAADDDIAVYFSPDTAIAREVTLGTKGSATAAWSTTQKVTPTHSVHLKTTGTVGSGDEARIVIPVAPGVTLATLPTLDWDIFTVSGYPAHVDIFLSSGNVLTAEMAWNHLTYMNNILGIDVAMTAQIWLKTFESATGNGPVSVGLGSTLWVANLGAGCIDAPYGTLQQWIDNDILLQDPGADGIPDVSGDTIVKLELEIDNWIAQTEVYIDNFGTLGLEPHIVLTTTDDVGSFEVDFDVPTGSGYGGYFVGAGDTSGAYHNDDFTVGASITLTPDEGPTGSVVKVEGRGWSPGNHTTFKIGITSWTTTVEVIDGVLINEVLVGLGGTFSAELVIPGVGSVADYKIEARGHSHSSKPGEAGPTYDSFEVTGIPKLVVSPTYGTPGAVIVVNGYNFTQIAGEDVVIELWDKETVPAKAADLVVAETKADGTFEDTFISPAVAFETYDVIAKDEYLINADDPFKVGLIALIINPTYGEAGTMISITGIGFKANSNYNVTFGTKLYEDYGTGVSDAEAISDLFYVPNFEPGTYDMTVVDEDENELTVQFSVTESTYVVADPVMAPNGYNVTFKGYNFADIVGAVDFVLYNETLDWTMNVVEEPGPIAIETDADGNFTAYWIVLDEDTLSIGDYTINVTGSKGLFVQVPFSVVAARVSVAPRKAQFDRGDMIQFDIKNDFKLGGSYIEIYDPYDTLYWITDLFDDDWWLLVEGLYTVPYYRQTAAENPMELQSDAPMGAWLYIFYDDKDDQLMNGTFSVGASTAAQVEEKLTQIWGSIDDLTTNIDSITDELAGDISDLSGDIDDVVADVQDMVDDITADLAEELAGVASDTEDAVGELEGSIGDIAAAQNELASGIEASLQESEAAREAAEDAQGSAQGLTTLVYGAIGASLIAALAAIVSLMQISKKIA